jgi:RNA polymerase sigma-70 factor (ECF subfamily)
MTKQERFTILYKPCRNQLKRFVYSIVRSNQQAEEIIADTLYYAYQNIDSLKNDKAFLSYLFTIARRVKNKIIKIYSKSDYELNLDEFISRDLSPDDRLDTVLLYESISKLKEKEKEALLLNEFSGLTAKEISVVQKTTIFNVKIRIFRAKKKLKILLTEKRSLN